VIFVVATAQKPTDTAASVIDAQQRSVVIDILVYYYMYIVALVVDDVM